MKQIRPVWASVPFVKTAKSKLASRAEHSGSSNLRKTAKVFTALALVDLGAELAMWNQWRAGRKISAAMMWTLMPTLIIILLMAVPENRSDQVWFTTAALTLSWLGDAIPNVLRADYAIPAKIGFFLLAQIAYIIAFSPRWKQTIVARHPAALAFHASALAILIIICGKQTGKLFLPALLYGITLNAMVALSSGTSKRATIGAAVFLLSDSLIALREFAPRFAPRAVGFWVMATYLAAQCLLVSGVVKANNGLKVFSLTKLWANKGSLSGLRKLFKDFWRG